MDTGSTSLLAILSGSAVISAVVAGVMTNRRSYRLKRKELLANATRSALERVEMYYRIRRRTDDTSDEIIIRDKFHAVQAENDYYIALLFAESAWLGELYANFISALKRETMSLIQQAWDEEAMGPGAKLENIVKPNHLIIEKYRGQFAKDSRRFLNPFMRIWMWVKYLLRRHIKGDGYGA